MAKRFTDTEKWKDPWFRKLSPNSKVLWFFLTENCDQAGFWKKDYELASFFCGYEITEDHLLKAFNQEKIRIKDHKTHVELCDFVSFQYGNLSPDCRPHRPILDLLSKYQKKGYQKGINTLEEKEKEKEKEKDFGKSENLLGENPEKQANELAEREKWFDELWQKYPNKDGKKHAKRHFFASVKNAVDLARINKALQVYLASERVKHGFVKNGSTWFNDWETWVNWQEPKKEETDAERDARIIAKIAKG